MGTYPGVGTLHSYSQNKHLGAYSEVGACLGHYDTFIQDAQRTSVFVFPLLSCQYATDEQILLNPMNAFFDSVTAIDFEQLLSSP